MDNNVQNSTNELVVRREKLATLKESGNDPFVITKYDVTHSAPEAKAEFESREQTLAEGETVNVRIAGIVCTPPGRRRQDSALRCKRRYR